MLRLITDFDGPIIDVSDRYYRVYQFCLSAIRGDNQPVQELSKTEFWDLKRARVPEWKIGMISGLDQTQGQAFAQIRRQTIHSSPYFDYDRPAPGAIAALEKVQQAGIDLVVMTMRRTRELDYACQCHQLSHFFPSDRCYCLANDYIKTKDIDDKPMLMERAIQELPPVAETWMVGDTEADIVAAKRHGVSAIGVLSGIRDRTQLERYEPDYIVDDLSQAVDLVLSKAPA